MNIEYNYISLVAIGNFNPAIVTPEFLKSDCGFDFGELTEQSPPFVPVLKKFQFEKIQISVDLERITLKETNVRDDLKTDVLNVFQSFYEVLPYTPLEAVGLNINCRFLFDNKEEQQSIEGKISSPKSYIDFLETKQVHVDKTYLFMEEEETWIASNFFIEDVNGLKRRIGPRIEDNYLLLNYNCEASSLKESKMNRNIRLKSLFKGYDNFCEEFLKFIKFLEG